MALSVILRTLVLLLALAASVLAEVERITILHVNDLHARLLPDERGRGGFAHLATAIKTERRKSVNPIVLHAGDMVQGSPVSTIFEGTPVFEVGNSLGIDAHCLGNHEFDYGWERILDFVKVSEAPILAANVRNSAGKLLVPPSTVLDAGGLKVGVVGALTTFLPRLTKPGQVGPWRVEGLVESLSATLARMDREVDLVVLLAHLFDEEEELALRRLPQIDVLIGGHNHGGRQTELLVDGRIGVKLRAYGRELGRLEVSFDTSAKRVVDYDWERIPIYANRYAPDAETARLVRHWESKVAEEVDVTVGRSYRSFDRAEVKELVERAIVETTGADIAYMNRGGVRDSLRRGTITARQIWNILPFDNALVEAEVLGRYLPEEVAGDRRVDPNRTYRFVTNDYVAGLSRYRRMRFRPTGFVLRDTFLDWVKSRGRLP